MWTYGFKMESNELTHHGILRMKWGVRRFQNRDGSLTAAGKKRRAADKKRRAAEETRSDDKKKPAAAKAESSPAKKRPSEMNDDELKTYVNRMQMEKQAYDLERSIASLNPQKVSAGKRFVTSTFKDVVAPALKEAGKNIASEYIKKKGKEFLGLNNDDSIDVIKKEVEKLRAKKELSDLKNPKDTSLKDNVERARLEKELSDLKKPKDTSLKDKVEQARLERELEALTNPKDKTYDEMREYIRNHSTEKAFKKIMSELEEEERKKTETSS